MRVKITVPSNLSEIKLSQYKKFYKIQTENEDDNFIALKMIQIFCGISLKESYELKATDVFRISKIISDMFEQKPQLVQRFYMNGIEYGFMPNLDDMSMGEYVDVDTYIGDWQEMEKAMSVLYRPIENTHKEKYNIKEYNGENFERMLDMPMDAVISSMLFFYRLGIDLSKTMMNYLEDKNNKHLLHNHNLATSGDGINRFTHSLRGVLEDLNISLN